MAAANGRQHGLEGEPIKKNKNTFAKLQRERQKKRKAEEKRQRRLQRKAVDTNCAADQTEVHNRQDDETAATE